MEANGKTATMTQIIKAKTLDTEYKTAISTPISSSRLSRAYSAAIPKISERTHIITAITIEYNANFWNEGVMVDEENKLAIKSIPPKYNRYLYHLSKINLLKKDTSSAINQYDYLLLFNPFKKSMPHFATSMPLLW